MRSGAVTRRTNETEIAVEIDLDGAGVAKIATGVGFFDHMLDQLARHSLVDMTVSAKGDLHIDDHHTVEDVGIALGQALRQALGDKRGLTRYADCLLPMDETLTRVALDISARPFGPRWLLLRGLWLALLGYAVLAALIVLATREGWLRPGAAVALFALGHLYLGVEGRALAIAARRRGGRPLVDVVCAQSALE